ncbi:Putative uncharacterized protein [Taphrina deformans PYCC 5710]|uniref:Uncharacterized protein n=1 Tax=Taphrina deformans (strain PYCC 5710 / ATCC 11124 / CBS 356.35 / IMI 108563 / JCM 9778 / NBRC 8474) TaxID=1097556 RepID=R4X7I9_TAPDE|nr:Putative uncharacterized protein [Taphrina deformans PYCC 5710]|eukprot:CCG81360.1 Putative uncharacterized protein [Taphrina deformans PYCC 5710]
MAAAQEKRKTSTDAGESKSSPKKVKTEGAEAKQGDDTQSADDILSYLLLDSTLDSISPPEILEPGCEKDLRYPHSDLPPFCALVSALLLSKPFSHRLGMRAIHQIFKEPYSFTTPKVILEAGGDDRWQALKDAHTLHKDKTSGQLRDLSELIKNEYPKDFDNSDLVEFREKAGGDVDMLQKNVCQIKGFAEKTTTLFFRRVQLQWSELFPYADDLALQAAKDMGLEVSSASELRDLLKDHLGDVSEEDLRRQYIRVLEVLIGKKLDKDIDASKEEVAEVKASDSGEGVKTDDEEKVEADEVEGKDSTES